MFTLIGAGKHSIVFIIFIVIKVFLFDFLLNYPFLFECVITF